MTLRERAAKGVATRALLLAAIVGLTALGVVWANHRANTRPLIDDQPALEARSTTRAPVLVELFTSEGCSSCPPADELLARLERTQPVPGAEVIALSEHVDYWNRLGWTDPYSSAQFSERQSDYARAFESDDVYTPQMIVDGRTGFVGSSFDNAHNAITRAAQQSKANVSAKLVSQDVSSATLSVVIESLPDRSDDAELLVAITESDLRANVSRGENAGRRLSHTAVVRKLLNVSTVRSQESAAFNAQPVLRIDKTWKRENLRAVVFLQERESRRVLGAAALSLAR